MDDDSGDGQRLCFLTTQSFLSECSEHAELWAAEPSTIQTNIAVAVALALMLLAIVMVRCCHAPRG